MLVTETIIVVVEDSIFCKCVCLCNSLTDTLTYHDNKSVCVLVHACRSSDKLKASCHRYRQITASIRQAPFPFPPRALPLHLALPALPHPHPVHAAAGHARGSCFPLHDGGLQAEQWPGMALTHHIHSCPDGLQLLAAGPESSCVVFNGSVTCQ